MKKVILFLGFSFICLEIYSQQNFLNTSFLSTGQWIRIGLTQSGIYKIEASQLSALGLNANPFPTNSLRVFGKKGGNLPEKIDSTSLTGLTEIPIETGSNYALFYAPGPHAWYYDSVTQTFRFEKNLYSDTAWYFITINSNPINGSLPKRIQTDPASPLPIGKIVRTYTDRYAYENPKSNLLGSGKEWVGENFNANQTTRTFSIPWTNAVSAEPLKLFTHLSSRSLGASAEFKVSLNGNLAQTSSLSSVSGGLLDDFAREAKNNSSVLSNSLANSNNLSLQFQYNGIAGAEGWLNRFSIQGQKQMIPQNTTQGFYFTITRENTGNLSSDSAAELQISAPLNNGASTVFPADTRVWDISDPLNPSIVVSANNGSEITVKTIVEIRKEFACFNPSQALTPIIPSNPIVPNQNLVGLAKGTANAYRGIIIVHPSLLSAANRLANFHQTQYGYKDLVITTTQCYNEFAAGIPDPAAIRNTLKIFYDYSAPASMANGKTLQYVLLFGAGTYDPKNILQNAQYNDRNLIPTFQSSNSLSPLLSYTSDDFYALLNNGDDVNFLNDAPLSIAVGRIPVSNLTEANQYINKLIRYHQPNSSNNSTSSNSDNAWRSQLVFIADDKDQNLHLNDAESIAAKAISANPALTTNKIYLDAFPLVNGAGGARYPAVSDAIVNQVLSGALMVNYSGHGNHLRLSEEAVISANEINRFNNPDKLPLFITASCHIDQIGRAT